MVLRGGDVRIWDTARKTTQLAGRLERSLNAAAFGVAGETLATAGHREGVVRIESLRPPGAFSLFRVLLGASALARNEPPILARIEPSLVA